MLVSAGCILHTCLCVRHTGVEALEALLVDQAAAFLPPGDVRRSALGCGQLFASTGLLQLSPGQEVPCHAVLCVLALYAAIPKSPPII